MEDERLLERLRAIDKNPGRRGGRDDRRLTLSILGHLERILNTRQGSVPIAEDMGVPDFTNLSGASISESTPEMERAIKQLVQKFEPRLTAVTVSFVPQEEEVLSLSFKVHARLAGNKKQTVVFDTVVGVDGKINVTG